MKRNNSTNEALRFYKSKQKELVLTYLSTELEILMQYIKEYSQMTEDKILTIRGALELACVTHVISIEDFNHYKKFLDRIYYRYVTEQKLDLDLPTSSSF